MSNKHQKTYERIFDKPDRKNIDWDDFINLLVFLGARVEPQRGSAYGIKLNGEYMVLHQPHPGHTIYPLELKRIRGFLIRAGIKKVE